MMTPKDRVKLGVYKRLLEEEKKKNRKLMAVGASMFIIGVFSDNVVERAAQTASPKESMVAYERSIPVPSNNEVAWENFFEESVLQEKNLELNAEELFVADLGI